MGKRIGFHYYDDQDHFTAADLDTWLPRLEAMGASWLRAAQLAGAHGAGVLH
ncbi:MAG: hypothetical protein M5R40_05675 [Anaerolineae bacterium]|nr:hypothetical protein [Anaerolineae bacterium]